MAKAKLVVPSDSRLLFSPLVTLAKAGIQSLPLACRPHRMLAFSGVYPIGLHRPFPQITPFRRRPEPIAASVALSKGARPQKTPKIQVLAERWVPACAGMATEFIAKQPGYSWTPIGLQALSRHD